MERLGRDRPRPPHRTDMRVPPGKHFKTHGLKLVSLDRLMAPRVGAAARRARPLARLFKTGAGPKTLPVHISSPLARCRHFLIAVHLHISIVGRSPSATTIK